MVSAKGLAQLIGRGQLAVTQSQAFASADLAMAKAHLSTAEERLRALNTKSQEIAAREALIKRRCRLQ
jgi:hypothetical protein